MSTPLAGRESQARPADARRPLALKLIVGILVLNLPDPVPTTRFLIAMGGDTRATSAALTRLMEQGLIDLAPITGATDAVVGWTTAMITLTREGMAEARMWGVW